MRPVGERSALVRLGAFAAGLLVVFGAAAAVGGAVGPIDVGGDHADVPVDHAVDHAVEHPGAP